MHGLTRIVKDIAFASPVARFLAPRYHYNFRPAQLAYLTSLLDEVRGVRGSVVEVGCFAGATTIYLSEHLRDIGPRRYVAIDTFEGFTDDDVAHEISARGKGQDQRTFNTGFRMNRRAWVARSLEVSGHPTVEVVQGDAGLIDYTQYGPIAFALIDVDLYQPVARALARILPLMSPGGRIMVDDCRASQAYDGALQAYTECCASRGVSTDIRHEKLGTIRT